MLETWFLCLSPGFGVWVIIWDHLRLTWVAKMSIWGQNNTPWIITLVWKVSLVMENHFQTAQTDLIGQNAICTISWPVAQNEWPKVGQGGYKELLGPVSGTSDWYFRLLSLDWYFRLLTICCQKTKTKNTKNVPINIFVITMSTLALDALRCQNYIF